MTGKQEKKITSEKPVSLYPLPFKDAVLALLKVKPETRPEKRKPRKKQTKKSSD